MHCPSCAQPGEKREFSTFSYWYCDKCKLEILPSSPNLLDEVSRLLNIRGKEMYLYVSPNPENLDTLFNHAVTNLSLEFAGGRLMFCLPMQVDKLSQYSFAGVFIDEGCLSTEEMQEYLAPVNTGFTRVVDPKTRTLK